MRSLKDFMGERKGAIQAMAVDDKTVFFLFRKMVREQYGLRGEKELEPALFKEGVLSVKANSPLYSSELWLRREMIVEQLNRGLGSEAVLELRLVRYAP